MRGVGTGILFTMFVFMVIIIPNLKLENKIAGTSDRLNESSDVAGLVGRESDGQGSEPAQKPTDKPTQTPTQVPTDKPTLTPTQVPTDKPTPTPTQAPADKVVPTVEEPTKVPTPTPKVVVDEDTGKVTFTITSGMTSETFSKAMENNGIVDDWQALNNYISKNGYAKKMQVGTFTFTPGMSYYEVCKKIMGKNMK